MHRDRCGLRRRGGAIRQRDEIDRRATAARAMSRRRHALGWLALAIGCLGPVIALAQTGARPVVAELFTSQGCSSCPPADALITALARTRPDLLLLTFHVTYWNRLGWRDPFSFQAATERQSRYVAVGISPEIYTPDLVVDGVQDVVGSDRSAVVAALARAAAKDRSAAAVEVARRDDTVMITIGAGAGRGTVLLIGYDRRHQTHVAFGENGGRTLLETNIVRSMSVIGIWSGHALRLQAPAPIGEEVAVLLQADDGHIIGAGRLPATAS
jgi:hypothetical protein